MNYQTTISTGTVKQVLFTGTRDSCIQYCEDNHWEFYDANGFQWELDYEPVL